RARTTTRCSAVPLRGGGRRRYPRLPPGHVREELRDVEPRPLEALRPAREAAGPDERAAVANEDLCGLDNPVLDAAGDRHDLADGAAAVPVEVEVDDEGDGGRDRGDDEAAGDVLSREEGQRAHLRHRLARRVRVDGAHPRDARIEGDEHVEALRLPELADDDS